MTITAVSGRDIASAERVSVYKNLTRGCWSIKALDGIHKGKVLAHADAVTLTDAVMYASAKRQAHIAAGGAREVHAWIIGTIADGMPPVSETARRVTYRPHVSCKFFIDGTGEVITSAPLVAFRDNGSAWIA